MKELGVLFFCFFIHLTSVQAKLIPDSQALINQMAPQKQYISKQIFTEELALMRQAFAPLATARNEKLFIMSDWTANDYANALSRRWPPQDQVIVYSGLAFRKEITTDALALVVCHELGHLFGNAPLSDEYNQISSEGQADYWAAQHCLNQAFELFNYKDDPTPARAEIQEFCEKQEDLESSLCVRALKTYEHIGAFVAHNANAPEPRLETPDETIVSQTVSTHNSPQCRLDTFIAGLLKKERPRCWYKSEEHF